MTTNKLLVRVKFCVEFVEFAHHTNVENWEQREGGTSENWYCIDSATDTSKNVTAQHRQAGGMI